MQQFVEGKLIFRFPDSWLVCKYDNQSFYRKHFSNVVSEGLKGLDFCAVDPEKKRVWLIEVKDYEGQVVRQKEITPEQEFIQKVVATSAGLFAAEFSATNANFKPFEFLQKMKNMTTLSLVLFYNVPDSKKNMELQYLNNLKTKMLPKLKAFTPHRNDLHVLSLKHFKSSIPWKVIRVKR